MKKSVITRGKTIDFPDSVIEFFEGYIGQPYRWFPRRASKSNIKRSSSDYGYVQERLLEPVDFEAVERRTYLTNLVVL